MSTIIIVTRHPSLVQFLKERGIEGKTIPHATEEDVKGKRVYGVLPHRLSVLTESYTEVSLNLPPELRGKELSVEDIRKHFKGMETYKVLSRERWNRISEDYYNWARCNAFPKI